MKIEARDITDGMRIRFPFSGKWRNVKFAVIGTEYVQIHTDKAYRLPLTAKVHVK